jgi:hypothetical protein
VTTLGDWLHACPTDALAPALLDGIARLDNQRRERRRHAALLSLACADLFAILAPHSHRQRRIIANSSESAR